MSRKPNFEQVKAIEHSGGVLLSAGAGSGKTFVLIHHILHLAKQWMGEYSSFDNDVARILFLQKKFSEIVLMTFTKEASGELSYRLQKRVEEEIENDKDSCVFWKHVYESMSSMTLTTIHGFCAKLLSQGFVLDFDPQAKLLSEIEYKDKISFLVNRWFDQKSLENDNEQFLEIVIANKANLISSFCKIFSDAKIRNHWNSLNPESVYKEDVSHILNDLVSLEGLELALETIDLAGLEKESTKAWHKNLTNYNQMIHGFELRGIEDINTYLSFFEEIKRFSGPPKKLALESVEQSVDAIKSLRKLLKDNREDFSAYFGEDKDHFINWIKATFDIFQYIERHYLNLPGINFSDYEYYVLKGLRKKHVVDKIAENYKYLIVDEFQDTSSVQFEIIEKIIKENYENLFCVGDIKQAIYGFRGGEIGVFKKCQSLVPLNLELNNNYRSFENIIKFNNVFFDHIFHKGLKFQNTDRFGVEVVPQTVPEEVEREHKGEINKLLVKVNLGEQSKLNTSEILKIEADSIYRRIKDVLSKNPDDNICVLYSKLTPLKYLLKSLIKEDIDFISQIKIKIDEDPFVSIFKVLIERELNAKDDIETDASQILGYLKYLRFENVDLDYLKDCILNFEKNINTLGLYFSVKIFFNSIGLSNSSYENNDQIIEQVCELAMDDVSLVWLLLNDHKDRNYSKKFQQGRGKVVIMTAHASKGLEFDHIFLCGIHNNGKRIPDSDFFGTLPGSFKWKSDVGQRKPFSSPELLLEKALNKRKDFSESKRLFYVANTRAIKTLTYAHIVDSSNNETFFNDANSWIKALDTYDFSKVEVNEYEEIIDFQEDENEAYSDNPLFHLDNLSLLEREFDQNSKLACIPELSVTRMTTLAQCPTKFYLMNICKISPDEDWFEKAGLYKDSIDENLIKDNEEVEFEHNSYEHFGAQRGTMIHAALESLVEKNMTIPRNITEKRDIAAINWVKSEFSTLVNEYKFIAETPIKFSFFGTMISGTPDLILFPESNKEAKVVDYKTGKFSSEKSDPYWFQLKIYAYALFCLGKVELTKKISIELWFVDEQKKYTDLLDYESLRKELYNFWKSISDLSQKNLEHCESCSFGNLCHFKPDSFATIL